MPEPRAELTTMGAEELEALRAQLDGVLRGMALMGVEPEREKVRELRAVEAELKRRNLAPARGEADPFGVGERVE